MKIVLINPPHESIGSRMANEHLPPLGLLSIAGPLIDAGHDVSLIDSDFYPLSVSETVQQTLQNSPDAVLLGHSGSTSAQPIINELTLALKCLKNELIIIVGGVFPTYHWKQILTEHAQIDYIVMGEGEKIITNLILALDTNQEICEVKGIAYRKDGKVIKTPSESLITNLEDYRIAWEFLNQYNYTYWGKKKAVVIQFSRGCPYPCTYCGQSLFWVKWRHRNPQLLADEIEMLHKKYGVEVINFADENPATNKKAWKQFLEALIAKNLDLILVGSLRADNIVRDAEILHLYKKAGFERFLLGIENYDEVVLERIKKAGKISKDKEAIQLLRKHNILSMATYVVGFGEETTRDFYNSLKQLLSYDPDQIQLLYATPHYWTPYFEEIKTKKIVENNQRKWDYKHQILATPKLKRWQVILYVKLIEIVMQTRPKAILRLFFHKDKKLRHAMMWYTKIGRRVWMYEWYEFLFKSKKIKHNITVADFWK